MSELTPDRIRDAAEVLRQLDDRRGHPSEYAWMPSQLDAKANKLEREQAAEATREKRIEDFAAELRDLYSTPGFAWTLIAAELIKRYPALAES